MKGAIHISILARLAALARHNDIHTGVLDARTPQSNPVGHGFMKGAINISILELDLRELRDLPGVAFET